MSVGLNTNIHDAGEFKEIEPSKAQGTAPPVIEKPGDHQTHEIAPPAIKNANQPQETPSPSLTRRAASAGQLSPRPANTADKAHDASGPLRPGRGVAERQAKAHSDFKEALAAAKEMLPNQPPEQRQKTLAALRTMVRNVSISGGRAEAREAFDQLHAEYSAKEAPSAKEEGTAQINPQKDSNVVKSPPKPLSPPAQELVNNEKNFGATLTRLSEFEKHPKFATFMQKESAANQAITTNLFNKAKGLQSAQNKVEAELSQLETKGTPAEQVAHLENLFGSADFKNLMHQLGDYNVDFLKASGDAALMSRMGTVTTDPRKGTSLMGDLASPAQRLMRISMPVQEVIKSLEKASHKEEAAKLRTCMNDMNAMVKEVNERVRQEQAGETTPTPAPGPSSASPAGKTLAQELEGAPERIQTRLPEEAHEIFKTETTFRKNLEILASLSDPDGLGSHLDSIMENMPPQDKAILNELKSLSSNMKEHHTGVMNQLASADNAKSLEAKTQIWSRTFKSESFRELDKDLARYATLYNNLPDHLKTALGTAAKQQIIQNLTKETNLSEKQLTDYSTVGFDFNSVKDGAQQKLALDMAIKIGNTQKEFGDTLMAPVQRGMRYGMLINTVAESAAKAPNLQDLSKSLSELSVSVNSLHKANDQMEAAASSVKNAKSLPATRPSMSDVNINYLNNSKGLIASMSKSKLSKSEARPHLESALQQLVNAHSFGQASKEDLGAALADLKKLPQAKELLGTFTGSATFKALVQSTEKLLQTPSSAPSTMNAVKHLALGNPAGADATAFNSLLNPLKEMLGAMARDPNRDTVSANNLLKYALEGMKHPDFKKNIQNRKELRAIADQAEAMGLNDQAQAIRNAVSG